MPTLEIKLTVPEGTIVRVVSVDGQAVAIPKPLEEPVARYFNDYLSNNGRKVYAAAARIEDFRGRPGFTFEDLAENLSVDYETVKSWHRTAGRAAKRWRRETGTEEPIRFDWVEYKQFDPASGERTAYRLPGDVAQTIRALPTLQPAS
jgi:hypothetical protein